MGRAVHIVKTLVALIWVHGGLLRLVHRWQRPHVLVLAYHRVTPDADLGACAFPAMHVSTRTFERQLAALRQLYRPIPMSTLHEIVAGRAPLREHVAVVTFDDGYRDNFQHAMPVLAKLEVPATFFLSLDFVDRGRPFWFDALAGALRIWDADPVVRERAGAVLPEVVRAAFAAPGTATARLARATAALKALPDDARETAVQALGAVGGEASLQAAAAPMTWDDVRTMRGQGMHFGAHGVRHAILTRMPPDAAEQEIQRSLEVIGARTGTAVEEFAYPNGDADDEVARRAAHAGVALAFTMRPGSVRPGDDPHRLARRNVCEDTSRDAFGAFSNAYFWCEITGVFDRLLWRGRRGRG